jgi:hypothetical protein
MGAWTMVVYLCHGFPIRWLHEWPYDAHLPFPATGTLAVVVTVALAVGWGLLLAWPPVATRLDYAVDPVNTIPRALWRSPGRRVS